MNKRNNVGLKHGIWIDYTYYDEMFFKFDCQVNFMKHKRCYNNGIVEYNVVTVHVHYFEPFYTFYKINNKNIHEEEGYG